jgi:tetratricopeptide (TPR) repeat protein
MFWDREATIQVRGEPTDQKVDDLHGSTVIRVDKVIERRQHLPVERGELEEREQPCVATPLTEGVGQTCHFSTSIKNQKKVLYDNSETGMPVEEEPNWLDISNWFAALGKQGLEDHHQPKARIDFIEIDTKVEDHELVQLQEIYLPTCLRWLDPTFQPIDDLEGATTTNEQLSAGESTRIGFSDVQSVTLANGEGSIADLVASNSFDLGKNEDFPERVKPASDVANKLADTSKSEATATIRTSDNRLCLAKGKKAMSEVHNEERRQILVKELLSSISTYGRYDPRVADASASLGDHLDESGEHKQSLKLYRDAVSIYSSKLGDDHKKTMDARVKLGRILEHAGEYNEAINTYYLATVMRKAVRGEKDPAAADSIVCIAHTLRKKGDYHQAIKELKRSLKIYRESLGDAHPKVSSAVDEIASLYVTLGDFDKSAAILEEVVKLKAATLGMNTKEVASTLISLATTYECSEQVEKSLKTLKKAYKIESEIGGFSSEGATSILNRIAMLYEGTGDYNRASIAFLGVLRGQKSIYGEEHLVVGEAYYKLGYSLHQMGHIHKALKCMKEALPIFVREGTETSDVERIAEILHEMGLMNKEMKNFHESTSMFKQELGVRRKIGQSEFPLITRALNQLGVVEFEMKNSSRALKYLVEALSIMQKHGDPGLDCAEVLYNSGLVFEVCNNKDRALEAFEESVRILMKLGFEGVHPQVVKAQNKIEMLQDKRKQRGYWTPGQ